MRLKGKVISWNDEKAFGFIKPNTEVNDVFIHKNALFNSQRTPVIGDIITFSLSKDKQGRACASEATFTGEKRNDFSRQKAINHKASKETGMFSLMLAVLFFIAIGLGTYVNELSLHAFYGLIGINIVTFFYYAFDKFKAQTGRFRTPESTLHLLALLGGWAGAAFAQQLFRHKSKKLTFRRAYWLTVIINIVGIVVGYLNGYLMAI